MTGSATRTASFTITDARYVGAKIGADLRLLHNLYGKPALAVIDDYVEEVALLIRDGYLGTVDYGFRQPGGETWKLRLRYTATAGGQLADQRPGRLPAAVDVAGLDFYSYLNYSPAFWELTAGQQAATKAALPINRSSAVEPTAAAGSSSAGHGYGRNGVGVDRNIYTAF